jgi:hypothetical protein
VAEGVQAHDPAGAILIRYAAPLQVELEHHPGPLGRAGPHSSRHASRCARFSFSFRPSANAEGDCAATIHVPRATQYRSVV